uniref:Uncharacterized protein n=1 Tax=Tanacetum cinerariifolium TaxID=118510 RepID=A0A699HY58_TANCI|nr:hypothetical protein [Tanacetum cinerariifolium]
MVGIQLFEKKLPKKNSLLNKKRWLMIPQDLQAQILSQTTDNSKRGLGYVSYNVVPHPHTGRFSPLRIELSHTRLPEFVEPSIKSYIVKRIEVVTQKASVKISVLVRENNGAPLIKDWESKGEDEVESTPEIERKTVTSSVDKVEVDIPKQNVKPTRRPVKYAEIYITQRPRGNQRNWNNLKSNHLGIEQSCLCEIHCPKDTWPGFHTRLLELDANYKELSLLCKLYQDSQGLQTLEVDTHKTLL